MAESPQLPSPQPVGGSVPTHELRYDIRRTYPCPCRKGEALYEAMDNDWGPPKSYRHTLLCPDCKGKYLYDRQLIGSLHDGGSERGWVLRDHLVAEQRYVEALRAYQQSIIAEVEQRCRTIWNAKLSACRTKKAVWEVLKPYGVYSTFLSHHRGKTLAEVIATVAAKPFCVDQLRHVLATCGIDDTPENLTSLAKPVPPPSLPAALWEPLERWGADTHQARSGPPSLDAA